MDNDANPYEGEVEEILENYVFPRYTKLGGREVKRQEVENMVATMEEYGMEDGTTVAEVGGGPGINVNLVQEFYEEFAETADYVVFDYFRDASGRKFYNDVMGDLNDNMPGNSQLHTDGEIIETVEHLGDVQYHDTDFWLPFGAFRHIESEKAMKAANWIQRHASGQENNLIRDAEPLWNMIDQQTRETAESLVEDATMALKDMGREEFEDWKQRASENDDSVGYIGLDTSDF